MDGRPDDTVMPAESEDVVLGPTGLSVVPDPERLPAGTEEG